MINNAVDRKNLFITYCDPPHVYERLAQSLKDSTDWERRSTSVPGVFRSNFPAQKVALGDIQLISDPNFVLLCAPVVPMLLIAQFHLQ